MRLGIVGAVLAALAILSGCSTTVQDDPDRPAAEGVDPAPTASLLQEEDLPATSELGDGWEVDSTPEGDSHVEAEEQGWLTPRDPAELVWGLAPLGCPDAVGASAYPLPQSALQGRYRTPDGAPAVALRIQMDDQEAARQLLGLMGSDAQTCTGPSADAATYARQYDVLSAGEDSLSMSFIESGPGAGDSTWHIVGVRQGAQLGLMYVEQPAGEQPHLPDPAVLLEPTG